MLSGCSLCVLKVFPDCECSYGVRRVFLECCAESVPRECPDCSQSWAEWKSHLACWALGRAKIKEMDRPSLPNHPFRCLDVFEQSRMVILFVVVFGHNGVYKVAKQVIPINPLVVAFTLPQDSLRWTIHSLCHAIMSLCQPRQLLLLRIKKGRSYLHKESTVHSVCSVHGSFFSFYSQFSTENWQRNIKNYNAV